MAKQTYIILFRPGNLSQRRAVEVQGEPVDIGAEGFEFFIHRPLDENCNELKTHWWISEKSTGMGLCSARTREDCITTAKAMIEKSKSTLPGSLAEIIKRNRDVFERAMARGLYKPEVKS